MKKLLSLITVFVMLFSFAACANNGSGSSQTTKTPEKPLTNEELLAKALENHAARDSFDAEMDISITLPEQESGLSPTYTVNADIKAQDILTDKKFSMTKKWRKSLLDSEYTVSDVYYVNGYYYVTENGENAKIESNKNSSAYDPFDDIAAIVASMPADIISEAQVSKDGDVTVYAFTFKTGEFKSLYTKLCAKIVTFANDVRYACSLYPDAGTVITENGKATLEIKIENQQIISHKLAFESTFSKYMGNDFSFSSEIKYGNINSSSAAAPNGYAEFTPLAYGMIKHEAGKYAFESLFKAINENAYVATADVDLKMTMSGITFDVPYDVVFKSETGLLYSKRKGSLDHIIANRPRKESTEIRASMIGMTETISVYCEDGTYYYVSGNEKYKEAPIIGGGERRNKICAFSRLEDIIAWQNAKVCDGFTYEAVDAETVRLTFSADTAEKREAFRQSNEAFIRDVYFALMGTIPPTENYYTLSGEKLEVAVKNGVISEFKISLDMDIPTIINGTSTVISSTVSANVAISDIGGNVTVEYPDGYKAFPKK